MGIILGRSSPTTCAAARPSPGLLAGEGHFSSLFGQLVLLWILEPLLNGIPRIRKWNPRLLNAQPAFGVKQAVGTLLFGGEVGESCGAGTRDGADDWGGVGKRRKCQEGLLVFHNEHSGRPSQKRLMSWVPLRS